MSRIRRSEKAITRMVLGIVLAAVVVIAAIAGSVLYFFVFQPSAETTGVITIGAIPCLTGEGQGYGVEWKRIVDLFVETYNKEGGIPSGPLKGYNISLVYADSQSSVDVGAREAERLITQQNVSMLIGIIYSSITKGIFPVNSRYQMPLVDAGASSEDITKLGNQWFWRIQAHSGLVVKTMFEFIKDLNTKTPGSIEKIAIASVNDEFGKAFGTTVKNWNNDATVGGLNLAAEIYVPTDAVDLSSECLTLKAANPDVIFSASHTPDAILLMKAYKSFGVKPKLILTEDGGYVAQQYLDAVGNLTDGLISRDHWAADLKGLPVSDKYQALWAQKYGYPMSDLHARYWMNIFVAAKAFELAGSTNNIKLRDALNTMDIPASECITPWGVKFIPTYPTGQFDAGQNSKGAGIMSQYFGTKLSTVWPSQYASKTLKFPVDWFTMAG